MTQSKELEILPRVDLMERQVVPKGTVIRTLFYNTMTENFIDDSDILTLRRDISGIELNSVLRSLTEAAEVRTLGFTLETEESVIHRNLFEDDNVLIILNKYWSDIDLGVTTKEIHGITTGMIKELITKII